MIFWAWEVLEGPPPSLSTSYDHLWNKLKRREGIQQSWRPRTPSTTGVAKFAKNLGTWLLAGVANKSTTGRPNRSAISQNREGCRRHSFWSMEALLSQSTCTLATPELCSALMERSRLSAQRPSCSATDDLDLDRGPGPGPGVPLAVDVGLGGHVFCQNQNMLARNRLA